MIIQITHNYRGELVVLTDKGEIFRKTYNNVWIKVSLPGDEDNK